MIWQIVQQSYQTGPGDLKWTLSITEVEDGGWDWGWGWGLLIGRSREDCQVRPWAV